MHGTRTKAKSIAMAAAMSVVVAGCIPSLYPFYTDKDIVFDPALVGRWNEEKEKDKEKEGDCTFQKRDDKTYSLEIVDHGTPAPFVAHLMSLGKYRFLDIYPDEMKGGNSLYQFHFVPGHTFWKVSLEGDTLHIGYLDPDWFQGMIREKKVRIRYENPERDSFVLTAPTKDLQTFVLKHAEDEKAFTMSELHRQPS